MKKIFFIFLLFKNIISYSQEDNPYSEAPVQEAQPTPEATPVSEATTEQSSSNDSAAEGTSSESTQTAPEEKVINFKDFKIKCPYGENLTLQYDLKDPKLLFIDRDFIDAYSKWNLKKFENSSDPLSDPMQKWMKDYKFSIEKPRGTDKIPDNKKIAYIGIYYFLREEFNRSVNYLKKSCESDSESVSCHYIQFINAFNDYPSLRKQIKVKMSLCKYDQEKIDFNRKFQVRFEMVKNQTFYKKNTQCHQIEMRKYFILKKEQKSFLYSNIDNYSDFPQIPESLQNYINKNNEYLLSKWNWERLDFDNPFIDVYIKPISSINQFCSCLESMNNDDYLNLFPQFSPENLATLIEILPEKNYKYSQYNTLIDVIDNLKPKVILFPFNCNVNKDLLSPLMMDIFLKSQQKSYNEWKNKRINEFNLIIQNNSIDLFKEFIKKQQFILRSNIDQNNKKKEYYFSLAERLKSSYESKYEAEVKNLPSQKTEDILKNLKNQIKIKTLEFRVEVSRIHKEMDSQFQERLTFLSKEFSKFLDREYVKDIKNIADYLIPFKQTQEVPEKKLK